MKNRTSLLLFLMTISVISCQNDEVKSGEETGSLHIDIGLFIRVHEENSQLKSTAQTEDFKVTIYKFDGPAVMTFERASDMPDIIELETGEYYVEAHSNNNLPAAFENPYYYGESEIFTISSNINQSVQVNCTLANAMVSVQYSENITGHFSEYSTTVSSALGSLLFSKIETRIGYFQPGPLDILVELSYVKPDGSVTSKTLSGNIPGALANRHYEIHVDASIDQGMATFQILMDESVVQVEVIEISDESSNQQGGSIAYGELLITEVMYNPSALSDTEGEWFEIYNHSEHVINLQYLVLGRDDANSHIIADPVELSPGEYLILSRTGQATNATNRYVYGSDILLPNTGAVLSLYNQGPGTDPGALIFAVDYGADNFPDGAGASISLSPDLINATDAILGASWCLSTSAYNTGDLGTPGAGNDPCL